MFFGLIKKCSPKLCLTALLMFIHGCAQTSLTPVESSISSINTIITPEYATGFGDRPYISTPDEIHRLTESQVEDFLSFMASDASQAAVPHERLFQYLETATSQFDYEDTTHTATQTLSEHKGNCLSLAVLTTALAKVAGIDVGYQLMDDAAVYEQKNSIISRGLHIRTKLYDPIWDKEQNPLAIRGPGIYVDYFPTDSQWYISSIGESEYLMMYYRNLAAERLAEDDLNMSFWYALEALKYAPYDSGAINILAVVSRRSNHSATAEALYRFGIANAEEKLSLLKNYHILLKMHGRNEEAKQIEQRLDRMEDPSPFNWIHLAKSAYDERDYIKAIRYYNKAVNVAPYLHEGYAGLAFSHYKLGNNAAAKYNLMQAQEVAIRSSVRSLYQAKLAVLQKE